MSRYAILLLLIAASFVALSNAQGCGKNERFTECLSPCTPTCKIPNPICIEECVGEGCRCLPGYVRNSKNECIPKNKC